MGLLQDDHQEGNQISRREMLQTGAVTLLGLTVPGLHRLVPQAPCRGVQDQTDSVELNPEEIQYLAALWQERNIGPALKLMRGHGVRRPQLDYLSWNSDINFEDVIPPLEATWPWKTQEDLQTRILQNCHALRNKHEPSWHLDDVRKVNFRPEEAHFLLTWYQEEIDNCHSMDELAQTKRGWHSGPAHRLVMEHLGRSIAGMIIIQLCQAFLDALHLEPFEAASAPAPPGPVVFPWQTPEEFHARRRDVWAYELRKEKARRVPGGPIPPITWPRESRDELKSRANLAQQHLKREEKAGTEGNGMAGAG